MDLPLPVEFLFIVVFLGEARFHLLESFIVHLGRINMAPHDLGAEEFGQMDTGVHRLVGMVGIIDRNINRLIHRNASSRRSPDPGRLVQTSRKLTGCRLAPVERARMIALARRGLQE